MRSDFLTLIFAFPQKNNEKDSVFGYAKVEKKDKNSFCKQIAPVKRHCKNKTY